MVKHGGERIGFQNSRLLQIATFFSTVTDLTGYVEEKMFEPKYHKLRVFHRDTETTMVRPVVLDEGSLETIGAQTP